MGVFYDVRVHLAEGSEDYVGKKGSIVTMSIRKVKLDKKVKKNDKKMYHKQIWVDNYLVYVLNL